MTASPELQDRPAQPYLAIRCDVTDGVPAAVDPAFPALFGWLAAHDVTPAGPPFIRYRELDRAGDPLVLDVGAPLSSPVPGGGPVHAASLPAGRYAVLLHVGPYRSATQRDLADAQADLAAWTAARGLVHRHESGLGWTVPCAAEHYRIGPVDEPDFMRWQTDLAWLVV